MRTKWFRYVLCPGEVGDYDTQEWVQQVALAGDELYLADDPGGLRILRFDGGP